MDSEINYLAIEELLKFSISNEISEDDNGNCKDRAMKICLLIASERRNEIIEVEKQKHTDLHLYDAFLTPELEFRIWKIESRRILSDYESAYWRGNDYTDRNFNDATYNTFALKLSSLYEKSISKWMDCINERGNETAEELQALKDVKKDLIRQIAIRDILCWNHENARDLSNANFLMYLIAKSFGEQQFYFNIAKAIKVRAVLSVEEILKVYFANVDLHIDEENDSGDDIERSQYCVSEAMSRLLDSEYFAIDKQLMMTDGDEVCYFEELINEYLIVRFEKVYNNQMKLMQEIHEKYGETEV